MKLSQQDQERFIGLAMEQAELAIRQADEPFGLVLVDEKGDVIAAAHNTAYSARDMLAHAEMNLIKKVYAERGRSAFAGCSAFINAASCTMCAAALIRAGVQDFYYGASFESHMNPMLSYKQLASYTKRPITVHGGILADECLAQIERGRKNEARP